MFMFCFFSELFFLLFFPFCNIIVFTSCELKVIFTCRLLVLHWGEFIWCVTFQEMCFTQRGPCVAKAQLQHHVPAVVAFLMENGCLSYFISGAEVMEATAGFTSDFGILVKSWTFPLTCIVALAFLCVRCRRLFLKSSALAAAVQSWPQLFLLPRNISTHQHRINSLNMSALRDESWKI